jgi:hypothetical protein
MNGTLACNHATRCRLRSRLGLPLTHHRLSRRRPPTPIACRGQEGSGPLSGACPSMLTSVNSTDVVRLAANYERVHDRQPRGRAPALRARVKTCVGSACARRPWGLRAVPRRTTDQVRSAEVSRDASYERSTCQARRAGLQWRPETGARTGHRPHRSGSPSS